VIPMEACATAPGWCREFEGLGHDVRLIPPIYVKPFVKRHKNHVADAKDRGGRRISDQLLSFSD
jgi:transposase